MDYFATLPPEVALDILSYLSFTEKMVAMRVNRNFKMLLSDISLWQELGVVTDTDPGAFNPFFIPLDLVLRGLSYATTKAKRIAVGYLPNAEQKIVFETLGQMEDLANFAMIGRSSNICELDLGNIACSMPHLRTLSLGFCADSESTRDLVLDLRGCYQLEYLKLDHCSVWLGQRLPKSLKKVHSIYSDYSSPSQGHAEAVILDHLEEVLIYTGGGWHHIYDNHWLSGVATVSYDPRQVAYPAARHSIKRLTIKVPQLRRMLNSLELEPQDLSYIVAFESVLRFRCRELESFHHSASGSSKGLLSKLNKYCPNLRSIYLEGLGELDPVKVQNFMMQRGCTLKKVTLDRVKLHVRTEEDKIDACNMLLRTAQECNVALELVDVGYCEHADEYWQEMSDSETD